MNPSQYLVSFQPASVQLCNAFQTIVDGLHEIDPAECQARALERLASIERAAQEERLFVIGRWNALTRQPGVLIMEGWRSKDSAVANVLAELLVEWHVDHEDEIKNRFNWLGWLASRGDLSVVVHASNGSRSAFATAREDVEDKMQFSYLARLLLDEQEIAQWKEAR